MYKVSRTHPPDQDGALGRLAELLPRREDRRPGLQRRGQVHAAADHGGGRHRLPRGGPAAPQRHGRDARAGAPARRVQGRARQRRGRRARAAGPARPLQRAGRELLRGHRRRVRPPAGPHRRGRRLEPRHDAGDGDGRAAPAARRRRRDQALRRRAPARGALPPAAAPRPTCCCSTSPPTTSTPSRWPGWSATSRSTRARSWRSPTTATSSTTWRAGSSSSTAGRASPSRATTRPGSSRSRSASPRRSARRPARQRTIAAELEWVRENPKGRRKKSKARLARYDALLAEDRNVKLDDRADPHPRGPAARRRGDRGRRAAQGLRRQAADRGPDLLPAPRGHRGRDRPQRRGQDHAVPDDHRATSSPTRGRCVSATRCELAYVDQSRDALDADEERVGGDLRAATTRSRSATGR